MPIDVSEVRAWTSRDSAELYNIEAWGDGYFGIAANGHIEVTPQGPDGPRIDLKTLVDDLTRRGIRLPAVLRFSDILADRVERIASAFASAIEAHGYEGHYQGVYPIKVNQERLVVEELVRCGSAYDLGLEAGSKPELLIALAHQENPNGLIICNGYKDAEYIELALMAQKLGRRNIIVLDRFAELATVIRLTKQLGVRPLLGVRIRLSVRGAGRWADSSGDRSKFGLTLVELMRTVSTLDEEGLLDCLQLLHFHIGSQITAVRAIKSALVEACRVYTELSKLGAPLRFLDVGGGLAVDYDGSQTNFPSSSNYTLTEYAADVVSAISDACERSGLAHPTIISESGRSLTAHHSVLVFDVLGVRRMLSDAAPMTANEQDHDLLKDLREVLDKLNNKNFQESFHDALQFREQAQTLFNVGVFDLEATARVEQLFWLCCARINRIIDQQTYVPEELTKLRRALADIYYCNFSIFQSVPDHWACKHLFPTLPIHRLNERPTRCATLADLTCDSDGKVDRFIDLHNVKDALELHELREGETYTLGMFLVGAYQEILGDLHNLFGDTHCLHVALDPSGRGYVVEEFEDGETVEDVLENVSYDRRSLVKMVRGIAEAAVRSGRISFEESAELLSRYERSLSSYTYLDERGLRGSQPSPLAARQAVPNAVTKAPNGQIEELQSRTDAPSLPLA